MKKNSAIPMTLIFIILITILIGCSNAVDTKLPYSKSSSASHSPVVRIIKVAESLANLEKGIFVEEVEYGKTYYLGFSVKDEDLDVSRAYINQTQISGGSNKLPEISDYLPAQVNAAETFFGSFTVAYTGTWRVDIYVVDAKGNKSNVCSATYKVKSTPVISNPRVVDKTTNLETTQVKPNTSYDLKFDLVDEDMDASIAYVKITPPNSTPVNKTVTLSQQVGKSVVYTVTDYFNLTGQWVIEIYVMDSKNNKSNTLTKYIYVSQY